MTKEFLGRADEWSRVDAALGDVRHGSFRVILIHGEAGIGKTRLTQEVVARAQEGGFAIVSGRAEDLERMRPFGAIADAVDNFARSDQRGTFVQDSIGFGISARRLVGFNDRDYRGAGTSANFEVPNCTANTRRASFNGEPLEY